MSIKIGVVGDGPIGNLVVAKLLIEHGRHNNGKNNIEITHFTSNRVLERGYSRRHVLFITEELVYELEKNVLDCNNCLIKISNEQILNEDDEIGQKFLFSTRLLENIIERELNNNNSKYCTTKCIFKKKPNLIEDSKPPDYFKEDLHYIFFATGTNSPSLRHKYFYDEETHEDTTVKIIAPQSNPIVVFYTHLAPSSLNTPEEMAAQDIKSQIKIITEEELNDSKVNLNDLENKVTIIYMFYTYIKEFIKKIKTDVTINLDAHPHIKDIINFIDTDTDYNKSNNLALMGYENFKDYTKKIVYAVGTLQRIFKHDYIGNDTDITKNSKDLLFDKYMDFLQEKRMRTHVINSDTKNVYRKLINTAKSWAETTLQPYSVFIYKLLEQKYNTCPMPNDENAASCINQKFLVNIVQQSLNSYGITNNKLVYAVKKQQINFFMIGDIANAYSAGISVEIGFRFVNYIIPMFYNFYINEIKTISDCSQLNILDILNDLLSEKYEDLLDKKINYGFYDTDDTDDTLKKIILDIRNNYQTNLGTLCKDDDIFLTYYNIVSLIQYIKNSDLIIKGKKLIGISNALRPSREPYNRPPPPPYNYKIMNDNISKHINDGQIEQFPKREGGRKNSKRSSKLKF